MPVALKLPGSMPATATEIAKLQHEYAILRELTDVPNIVKTLGLELNDAGAALILEDIEGQSLAKLLEREKLPLAAVLSISATIVGALDALHRRSILYKDVSPNNILITSSGAAFLLDFGLASRLSHEPQHATRPAAVEGTLAYISPELQASVLLDKIRHCLHIEWIRREESAPPSAIGSDRSRGAALVPPSAEELSLVQVGELGVHPKSAARSGANGADGPSARPLDRRAQGACAELPAPEAARVSRDARDGGAIEGAGPPCARKSIGARWEG